MTRPERVELDLGLCMLSIQLTLNEALVLQALLNSSESTEVRLRFSRHHPAEFYLPAPPDPLPAGKKP